MKPPRSLKARALQLLSQREQSRVELRRKLLAHLKADEAKAAQARAGLGKADEDGGDDCGGLSISGSGSGSSSSASKTDDGGRRSLGGGIELAAKAAASGSAPADAASRVEAVLDWLEVNQFASDERFAESRVHARSARYGNLRIRQELKQHAVVLAPEAARALAESEAARAAAVYGRRFAGPPETAAERAKRARFLTARGFSPEVVRQVLRAAACVTRTDGGAFA